MLKKLLFSLWPGSFHTKCKVKMPHIFDFLQILWTDSNFENGWIPLGAPLGHFAGVTCSLSQLFPHIISSFYSNTSFLSLFCGVSFNFYCRYLNNCHCTSFFLSRSFFEFPFLFVSDLVVLLNYLFLSEEMGKIN